MTTGQPAPASPRAPGTCTSNALTRSRPINVVFLIDNLLYGGAQKFLGQIVTGLQAKGFELTVVCLNKADPVHLQRYEQLGVRMIRYTPVQFLTQVALFKFTRFLKQEQPDVVMCILPFSDALGRTASRLAGVPHVVSAIRSHKNWWELALGRLTAGIVEVFTVNARSLDPHTRKGESGQNARIECIMNGIDLADFASLDSETIRNELGLSSDDKLVVCLGRLSPEKGQAVLLEAAMKVLEKHAGAYFLFVGNGDQRDALEQRANGFDRIRFRAGVDDVRPVLGSADLLVIPSLHEATPNVLLEGMAAGLPVVASRYGGIPDLLLENETGLLATPGDAVDLEEQICRMLSDEEQMQDMGHRGRQRIAEKFSVERLVDGYEKLFRELVES